MSDCLFCKIANGNGSKVYEDDKMVIIKDIAPQAKLHYLAIPKQHFNDINDLSLNQPDLLAYLFRTIAQKADELGLRDGFRVITNKGDNGCQSIHPIHIHILGGEKLSERMG